MDIVRPLKSDINEILELMHSYYQDLSVFTSFLYDDDTSFEHSLVEKYFDDDNKDIQIIKYKKNIIGFVFYHHYSHLNNDSNTNDIEEFYILREYRKLGFGRKLIKSVFMELSGRWEVRVRLENKLGLSFWKKTILLCEPIRFSEIKINEEKSDWVVYQFII